MTKNTTPAPIEPITPVTKKSRLNDLSSDVIPLNLKQVEKTYRLPTKTDTTENINKFWETMKLEDKNSQLNYLMKNYHNNEVVSESEDTREFSFSNSVLENSIVERKEVEVEGSISMREGDLNGSIEAERVAKLGDFEFEICKENVFKREEVQKQVVFEECEAEIFNCTDEKIVNENSNNSQYFYATENTEIVQKKVSGIKTKQSELKPIILHKSLESAVLILKPGARFHDKITLQSFQGYVIKGKISIKIDNKEYKATRDDMFLIKRKTVYDIHSESDTKLLLVFNPKE